MDLATYEANGSVLIRVTGRIVLDECDRLKSTITSAFNSAVSRVHLDLSGVDFVDSAGLGALVGVKISATKHNARLSLLQPSRGVSDILMVSKLDSLFDIVTGAEAEKLIGDLAQPSHAREAAPSNLGSRPSGPAMPAMPSGSGPATAQPPADSDKERIEQLCRAAMEHMRKADYESAAGAYREALSINPDYLPAHNNLAIVYEKRAEWRDKAIEQWNRVLEISQRNTDQKHIARAEKHLAMLQRE